MEYQYYVVEFLKTPIGLDKFVCVPQSWVQLPSQDSLDIVVVKYPSEKSSEIKELIKEGDLPRKEWPIYLAHLKHKSESYREGDNIIENLELNAVATNEDLVKETNGTKSVTYVPSNNYVDRRSDAVATTSKGTGSAQVVEERGKKNKQEKQPKRKATTNDAEEDASHAKRKHKDDMESALRGVVELVTSVNELYDAHDGNVISAIELVSHAVTGVIKLFK